MAMLSHPTSLGRSVQHSKHSDGCGDLTQLLSRRQPLPADDMRAMVHSECTSLHHIPCAFLQQEYGCAEWRCEETYTVVREENKGTRLVFASSFIVLLPGGADYDSARPIVVYTTPGQYEKAAVARRHAMFHALTLLFPEQMSEYRSLARPGCYGPDRSATPVPVGSHF